MVFDDTYTDRDFKNGIREANDQWINQVAVGEPDLAVDGLRGTFFSRLLALFSAKPA
jgi:hypothetical protein